MRVRYRMILDDGSDGPVVVVQDALGKEKGVVRGYLEQAFPWLAVGNWWVMYSGLGDG